MNHDKGRLVLIPSPIAEGHPLDATTWQILNAAAETPDRNLFLIEEAKVARKRWIEWKLPRSTIQTFQSLNEHTNAKDLSLWIKALQDGKNLFLTSDCGLPAICDPGRELVDLCHRHHIQVTATSFPNSFLLALALSGFPSDEFHFFGFPPQKTEHRKSFFESVLKSTATGIVMETPYRFGKAFHETAAAAKNLNQLNRQICVAMNLNEPNEEIIRIPLKEISKLPSETKAEGVLIVAPKDFK